MIAARAPARRWTALLPAALLAACQPGGDGDLPGDRSDRRAFAEIGAHEELRFTGIEPFWGGQVTGERMVYTTPDNPDGEAIAVTRFAGRGGLSFSGKMARGAFTMAVTPGTCSDGMSDRSYPYTVTIAFEGERLDGCGWTERQPFTGPAQP